jgi:hypothetical protein
MKKLLIALLALLTASCASVPQNSFSTLTGCGVDGCAAYSIHHHVSLE